MYKYEILNGEKTEAGKNHFSSHNRGLRYGDGLFETIKVVNGKPLFFKEHLLRLKRGLKTLHLNWPTLSADADITKAIELFVHENNIHNCRLRLTIFRDTIGLYKPATDNCSFHISGEKIDNFEYTSSDAGISLGLYRDETKTTGNLSNCKTLNCLIYVLAAIESRNKGFDDMLLVNINQNILESTNSNIFIRTGQSFMTPPLLDGCLDGVMRKVVIQLLRKNGIPISEQSITEHDLFLSDEILLTNVISGVRWVSLYNEKSYQNTFAPIVTSWLNNLIKN